MIRQTTALLIFLFTISISSYGNGNNTENTNTKKYRVVAVKKGDEKIVSVSNTVEVAKKVYVYIPNAFTPDGDGINDTFGAKGVGMATYKLTIYNRWGEMVFQSESQEIQWDGTYMDTQAPEGSYVYELLVQNEQGNDFHKQTGSVTLLR